MVRIAPGPLSRVYVRRRYRLGDPVRTEPDLPAVVVDGAVVVSADEREIFQHRRTALVPRNEMMSVTPARWTITSGERTAAVAQNERALYHARQGALESELGVLRSQGVVATRREGKNIFYSVADPDVLEILLVLYRLYCRKK